MKKLLFISSIVLVSFGFTFSGDSSKDFESDCPYLNQIHSSSETLACPYLDGKASQKESDKKENLSCPYSGKITDKSSECPYLNKKEKVNSGETTQPKVIKLKAS